VLLVGALPWLGFALAAAGGPRGAWRAMRDRVRNRDAALLLLLYWFLLPLAVFFLARSRLQLYVLPLFVPMALLLARPLATWGWLDRGRTGRIAGTTAVALLAAKATLAYYPADRDARAMAKAIRQIADLRDVEKIAFVDMKPFYGLRVYLDRAVEGVLITEPGPEYSEFLPEETRCEELAQRERTVFVAKRSGSGPFLAAVAGCSGLATVEVGGFSADDNDLVVFALRR
jgi:4-amino-4-deoxy-L-arabinose transferase